MEEAALAVQIKRAEKAKAVAKQQEERLKRAAAAEAAQRKEGLRIIYADFANAMRQGDFQKIYTLVDKFGLDINWEDTYGNTPLIAACRYGLAVPIRKLCDRGAEPDYENQFGMTPLIEACRGGHSKLLPLLMFDDKKRPRCSVDLRNKWGKTARDYAIECHREIKILPILDAGVGEQAAALAAIFGETSKTKEIVKKQKKPWPSPKQMAAKVKHKLLTPHRRFKEWHYNNFQRDIDRENAALVLQRFFRTMICKKESQGVIQDMIMKAIAENVRLKKMNFFIVKLQRVYRGKKARNLVQEMRRRIAAAIPIQATWRMYIYRKNFMEEQLKAKAIQRLNVMASKIQRVARKMLMAIKRAEAADAEFCAIIIQRNIRIKLARNKVRVLKWNREHKLIVEKLEATILPIFRIAIADRIKLQIASGIKIKEWIRGKHKTTLAMALYRRLQAKRKWAATSIQRITRGFLARALANRREAYRREHINGLPSVLRVKKLGTGHGMGNSYRIGGPDKYGYCSKKGCDCNKFGPADHSKPLICFCGHFITNHVVGIFRDSEKDDYYIAKSAKRTNMTTKFHMATGVERNYDSFYRFLRSNMTTKDLGLSLNASTAPVQLPPEIRKPSVTDLQKYIRKKLTSPRFLVGVPVAETESPSERRDRRMREHIERIRKQRIKLLKGKGGEVPTPPKVFKKGLFRPQMITNADKTVKLNETEVAEVEFVELQAKASLARSAVKLSNIEKLNKEIFVAETNLNRIRKSKNKYKKQEQLLKEKAKRDSARYKMKRAMHFKSLELAEMKKRGFKSAHEQLMDEHKAILEKRQRQLAKVTHIDYGEPATTPTSDDNTKRTHKSKNEPKDVILKLQTPPSTASTDVCAGPQPYTTKPDAPPRKQKTRPTPLLSTSTAVKGNGELVIRGLMKGLASKKSFASTSKNRRENKESHRRKAAKRAHHAHDHEEYEDDFDPYFSDDDVFDPKKVPRHPRSVPKYETVVNILKGMIKAQVPNPMRPISPQTPSKPPPQPIIASDNYAPVGYRPDRASSLGQQEEVIASISSTKPTNFATREGIVGTDSGATASMRPKRIPLATLVLISDESDSDRKLGGQQDSRLESHANPPPQELHVYEGRTVVGREMGCDIVLDSQIQSRMISKVHSMIYASVDASGIPKLHLVDCNSTNGTYVNGARVSMTRTNITDGATVMFGRKSRKKEKRSELIYHVKLHEQDMSHTIPKKLSRPVSTRLYGYSSEMHSPLVDEGISHVYSNMRLPATPETHALEISADVMAYRKMPLPATPETSEMQFPLLSPTDLMGEGNGSNKRGIRATVLEGSNKRSFPSMLVVRAPSRGSVLNSTDALLSKAWPDSGQLNWVVRGSSRHGRVRRRLVRTDNGGAYSVHKTNKHDDNDNGQYGVNRNNEFAQTQ